MRENLDWIAKQAPNLRYVQIDDGYQPAMGDWLETGTAFGGDVRSVLKEIKTRGFEPAIWVAPFIAEQNSKIFQQHPDWFMKTNPAPRCPPTRSPLEAGEEAPGTRWTPRNRPCRRISGSSSAP